MTRTDVVATLTNIIPGVVHRLTARAPTPWPYTALVPVLHRDFNPLVAKQRGEWYATPSWDAETAYTSIDEGGRNA